MRWFRTGHNDNWVSRRYYLDHFTSNQQQFDQENYDPASDSSAFESDCDDYPRPQLSNAARTRQRYQMKQIRILRRAGPQEDFKRNPNRDYSSSSSSTDPFSDDQIYTEGET